VRIPRRTPLRWLRDQVQYSQIVLSSLFWYTFPRFVERWEEVRGAAAGVPREERAVREIAAFFIAHRVLGSTGGYGPLGFRVPSPEHVAADALGMFNRFFSAGPEARAAFLHLLARAEGFNPSRRSTQYRKTVFHALRVMQSSDISQIPIFEEKKLIGTIYEDKILNLALQGKDLRKLVIREVMGKPLPQVPRDAPIERVTHLLSHEGPAVFVEMGNGHFEILTKFDLMGTIAGLVEQRR